MSSDLAHWPQWIAAATEWLEAFRAQVLAAGLEWRKPIVTWNEPRWHVTWGTAPHHLEYWDGVEVQARVLHLGFEDDGFHEPYPLTKEGDMLELYREYLGEKR